MSGFINRETTTRTNKGDVKMRKVFLALLAVVLIVSPVLAATQRNTFASWYSVSNTQTTITLPDSHETESICIWNGGSVELFLDLQGGTISNASGYGYKDAGVVNPSIIGLDADANFCLDDFATNSISLRVDGGTSASPVTVILTY